MAPQQMNECPHGRPLRECEICEPWKMNYLEKIGSNWNTINRNNLQVIANMIYPDAYEVHNQRLPRFNRRRERVQITPRMRNLARRYHSSYGRNYRQFRNNIAEQFWDESVNAIHNQNETNSNVNRNFNNNRVSQTQSPTRSNKSAQTPLKRQKK
jgi:hypothetical protein